MVVAVIVVVAVVALVVAALIVIAVVVVIIAVVLLEISSDGHRFYGLSCRTYRCHIFIVHFMPHSGHPLYR